MLIWLIPPLWTLALGLWGLSRQHTVWRDEAATWQVAGRSTPEILRMLHHVDVVHGLYYLLMHALFSVFGPHTTTLRLPSVLAGAVAATCVALIGRRLAGPAAGLAGGLAFGLLPAVQFYLQEGRPYALVAAGAGVSTLLLVAALQEDSGPRRRAWRWAGYGGAVLVCGLLNWFSLLILPAHLATLLWSRAADRRTWAAWTAASAVAVLAVTPLALFSRGQSAQVSWIPPLTWHMLIGPGVLVLIGGVCAVVSGRRIAGRARTDVLRIAPPRTGAPRIAPPRSDAPRTDGPRTDGPHAHAPRTDAPRTDGPRTDRLSAAAVGLPLLAVPQLGLVCVSLFQPLFLDRYVLFSMLGLALLIGAAIGAAVRAARPRFPRASAWIVPVAVALATVALIPQSLAERSPKSRVDDVMAVASDVQRLKRPGNAVLFIPSARRDTESVSPGAFSGLHDIALTETPERSGTLKGLEAAPARIRTAMLARDRILLVTDVPWIARPLTAAQDRMKMRVLLAYFTPVADVRVHGRRLTVYERLPRPARAAR
ncbi:glycosyltransferase family 39 protein [Streptomyces sp. NPDC088910]|uniref:glycosyltransferase family 39 protein n=1 Tax=Streptomyces sp. NPDC088910 TaxID=3365911 RepID=UPI003822F10B